MELEPKGAPEAYDEIVAHIKANGGEYSNWYCGITSDWASRLFDEHKVPPKVHPYIARQCYSDDNARAVENALIELGCDGEPGGGDETSVYVYAYLKGTMTDP
jgi:hypothetical protein